MIAEKAPDQTPFLGHYLDLHGRQDPSGPAWLQRLRGQGIDRFRQAGFPAPNEEAWRFTRLKSLEKVDFTVLPGNGNVLDAETAQRLSLAGEQPFRMVFANGGFVPALSTTGSPEKNPELLSLLDVANDQAIEKHLGNVVDLERHRFSALNTAFISDGACVRVPSGWHGGPIHLLFVSTGQDTPCLSSPRVLVMVEDGAEATILEEHVGPDETVYFTNSVTEFVLGNNASAEHVRLQREGSDAFHIGSVSARLSRDSRFTSHAVSLGGRLSRTDVDAVLDGEGAECTLNGLYLPTGRQHVDHHTYVDHASPHTVSHELYEGVLDDKATGVFNGRILIRPQAQKVDASQSNNNLLLSNDALVNTNPELEIFADDVKAQHGATIGQIEDEHLFYLRSRGIDERAARHILIRGFAGKMIDRIPTEAVREGLTTLLDERF